MRSSTTNLYISRERSPRSRRTRPNPVLQCRIDKLRSKLAIIQKSVDNREFLMDLALEKYDASYLISPKYKKWEAKAMAENRTFYSVQKEIFDKSADIASREKIHEWEEKVQGLERGTFHSADVAAESNGWIYRYFPGEFKVGWTWRNAESTGMETGEGIDLNDASKPKPAKGTLKVANLKKNYEPSKNLGRPPWRY